MQEYQTVLDYWFGNLQSPSDFPKDKAEIWFQGGEKVDKEVIEKFSATLQSASQGQLEHWKQSPKGRLALIIVLDQFPRNIHRGTPQAFAYDAQALEICLEGLKTQQHQTLFPVEKKFFYMPMQHSENIKIQQQSLEYYGELAQQAPSELQQRFQDVQKYAKRHWEIVDLFGRFPHRNHILGRASTPEEIEFLKTPNSSF